MDGSLTKKSVAEGATVILPQDPSKEGYTFLGWFDSEGAEYLTGFAPVGNITLFAKFEETQAESVAESSWEEVGEKQFAEIEETWEG